MKRAEVIDVAKSDADMLNDRMVEGLAQGDSGVVASVYASDARLMPPGMDVQTGGDIRGYWQGAIDAGLRHARIETVSYEEHAGLAVEEGRWELRASADAPIVDAGKFLIVHKRQLDGGWKYAFDMFNSSRAATDR